MNRWCDIPEDFYHKDNYEDNLHRVGFLKNIGININNIPESMCENFLWLDEYSLLINKKNGKSGKVCIKDVIGTTHQDYGNIPLIKAFKRLKRNAFWCDKMIRLTSIPYQVQLRRSINGNSGLAIRLIKIGDKYYINEQGNHRLITYKILYLAEMKRAKSITQQEIINDKYLIQTIIYDATDSKTRAI